MCKHMSVFTLLLSDKLLVSNILQTRKLINHNCTSTLAQVVWMPDSDLSCDITYPTNFPPSLQGPPIMPIMSFPIHSFHYITTV